MERAVRGNEGVDSMIYGIGIDLVRIKRMKDVVDKWGKKFIQRVFTKDEISYCYEKEPLSFSRSPFGGKRGADKGDRL